MYVHVESRGGSSGAKESRNQEQSHTKWCKDHAFSACPSLIKQHQMDDEAFEEISLICSLPNIDLSSLEALNVKLKSLGSSITAQRSQHLIEIGRKVYSQGLQRSKPYHPVMRNTADTSTAEAEEDKRIAPFIMGIGFTLLEMSCKTGNFQLSLYRLSLSNYS